MAYSIKFRAEFSQGETEVRGSARFYRFASIVRAGEYGNWISWHQTRQAAEKRVSAELSRAEQARETGTVRGLFDPKVCAAVESAEIVATDYDVKDTRAEWQHMDKLAESGVITPGEWETFVGKVNAKRGA
ncbi:hypothetical protein SEA_SCHMIDT_30 [Gordonia phage Schmidt]|uniref:Uncharacterized protein n=1 Tax=Gordonia phage Schmidt TaxID=2301697 RepID=A0A385E2S2_9CAUD|nr:hypothetical protein KDJ59_gp30 [Gordonia phage Schmidt]AXQ65152.1 hypothetical protein SEA_SCHMIDT_30 [Gordonia phage Schmidt]